MELAPPRKGKGGRPKGSGLTFTQAIADRICEEIAKGRSLLEIVKDEGMPSRRTVYDWRDSIPEFNAQFARARDKGWDAMAEFCTQIADNEIGDVQRDRLRVETRLKLLAKWCPQRYGDNLQVQHSGEIDIVIKIGGVERQIQTAHYSRS